MPVSFDRRSLILASIAAGLSSLMPRRAGAAIPDAVKLGPAEPFSFESLTAKAEALARGPFKTKPVADPELLERIDFDAYQQIGFREEATLWQGERYPVRLFHPGRFFKEPVRVYTVADGQAREVLYSPELFSYGPKAEFARKLSGDHGFAGFRVMSPEGPVDWLAFLGASYFRSAGELAQYGLSARGLAIDTAMPTPEEFPRFTSFHLEQAADGIIIHALMESPSVTGAYRIKAAQPKQVVMDVEARIFARKDVARLGVAPLTSMFWYSELNRVSGSDWRPQIHDSDGLALWTGSGERLWRPLNNPPRVMTNSFVDENPKGFGLLQRDRNFENYQDDGVFYDRRPSVWVEPKGNWGRGAVQLVEIPTNDEIHDNIVAYWVPEKPMKAGDALAYDYRLHWTAAEPYPPVAAVVVATRRGRGGRPGTEDYAGKVKYAIDLEGADLAARDESTEALVPDVTASRGKIEDAYALRVKGTPRWRVIFDLKAEGAEPVDLRCFLKTKDGKALTETWISQHFPGQAGL